MSPRDVGRLRLLGPYPRRFWNGTNYEVDLQGMSVESITSRSWRYCPQSHRESRLPITMTVKPTAASQMEYGGS